MFAFQSSKNRTIAGVCLALAIVTLILYWPLGGHDFINIDDPRFVTENTHVQAGLTWAGVVWAFQSVYTENWQPLTWMSHMMDCQLYGMNPGGHHLTSLLFHTANTLLLFLLLNQLTGAVWRGAMVAALFAWHPLHVESVAWVAERKDVLSTFFLLLTLLAYTRHVTGGKWQVTRTENAPVAAASPVTCHLSRFYWLALLFFALGLMSKPMVVTLPCVLLLLDFWPLQRFPLSAFRFPLLFRLLLEKIPFFILAAAISLVTLYAQRSGGAIFSLTVLPLHLRVENALLGYADYLSKTFWPVNLAFFYPYNVSMSVGSANGVALLLLLWTGFVVWQARTRPWLAVGWFWFLGTLVPTIGLVHVGWQSIADRYMYIPSMGLFILVVWGLNDFAGGWLHRRIILSLLGCAALAGCFCVTSRQLGYWQNSLTLSLRAIQVTKGNYVAFNSLGEALDQVGEHDKALSCYAEAVRFEPRYLQAQFNLAMGLLTHGRPDEAREHFESMARMAPNDSDIQYNLGIFLLQNGEPKEAIHYFNDALANKPDFPQARKRLAEILATHPDLTNSTVLDSKH